MRRKDQYFAPMRFIQHDDLYRNLPMSRGHLPDEGFDHIPLTLAYYRGKPLNFMVSCLPKYERVGGKSSKHRVYVHCPCDRMIPFGRMTQHYGGPRCRKDLVE